VLERSEYEPYGKLLNRPLADGPGYAGHVSDAATGLSYMQQRYYDPRIGVFLSVDPVTADGATGANFNRYWYGNSNPYRFTDPDGRLAFSGHLCDMGCDSGSFISSSTNQGVHSVGPINTNDFAQPVLIRKPVDGEINKKNQANGAHTADGGFDPDGRKKLRSGGSRHHKGIDIGALPGTPVLAAGFGYAKNMPFDTRGYGNWIVISHGDGLTTRYGHLSSSNVADGEFVFPGSLIGLSGRTGNLPSGAMPHLHFEVRQDGEPVDPLIYFDYKYQP
jgi:RHS repeat-associated protein